MDFIDFAIYLSFVLVGVAVFATVVLPLVNSLNNPKTLVRSGIGVVVLLVLFGVSYSLSGSETPALYIRHGVSSSVSQLVGGGIIMTYILIALAFISWIVSELSKAFK